MKKSTIMALVFLAICLLSVVALVVYNQVYIPYKIEKEEQEAKEEMLQWLAEDDTFFKSYYYDESYHVIYGDEPWYDEYVKGLFTTLTDKQFATTIVSMVTSHYDVGKFVSDQEIAERLLPDILDPDWVCRSEHGRMNCTIIDLLITFEVYEYYNPYLLNGIKDAFTWDGKSLDDLYNMSDYYGRALWAGDNPEDYYYYYITCNEDDLLKSIEGQQKVFYTRAGLGGYYDGKAGGYGDFRKVTTTEVGIGADYFATYTPKTTYYFRGKSIYPEISIPDAKYFTGTYLIFVDNDNNLKLAKDDGNSYDVVDGMKLE